MNTQLKSQEDSMSMIASLRNVASSTRLKEGSLEALSARIEKVTKDMTDIEKAKVETAVLDAFTSVSATLDKIELDQAETTVNRLRGNSASGGRSSRVDHGFKLPKGDAA